MVWAKKKDSTIGPGGNPGLWREACQTARGKVIVLKRRSASRRRERCTVKRGHGNVLEGDGDLAGIPPLAGNHSKNRVSLPTKGKKRQSAGHATREGWD